MSVFSGDYASNYDVFYADKDYAAESAFVGAIIKRHRPDARSILELGCGSARHAIEFARSGFSMTGIDRSEEMIAHGKNRIRQLPPEICDSITLSQGDATTYQPAKPFDAVASLFHVVSYQTSNDSLMGIMKTAWKALPAGGIFVFDFWYGPAVLTTQPEGRVRRIKTPHAELTRIAEPTMHGSRNVVDVKYTLIAVDLKSGRTSETTEVHSMRYLFLPEIEMLAAANGFSLIEAGEWLTGHELTQHSWSGYAALRREAGER